MNLKSFLFALNNFLVFGVFLPAGMVFLNSHFGLPVIQNPVLKIVGLIGALIGVVIFIYCSGLFRILGKGTPVPLSPPKELVIKGLYRQSRNPIYIGYMLVFLGYFMLFGYIGLLAYSLLIAIGLHFYVVLVEEPELKDRFGQPYIEYMKKVRRWI